ncbi:response regulator [Halobacillus salinarum]|uniref:Response regulator n=1 Tax=Halobacillus salinarum TaxID=2932257 RepID=A0ABY4EMF9_9BACI|nr:response regulator [Halobacillus salinarum]UOQ45636.1 response regulator [Halobacillus salinarum]
MSLRIIIVDDEPVIRRGLSATVPWEEHEMEVVGQAGDGWEAIRMMKEHGPVDLIITDVRMPHMDGLELASFTAEHFPAIKIIMISGYDDFKYAKKALQLGVQDYLLKPVDVDELIRVSNKIKKEILLEQNENAEYRKTKLKNAIYHQVWDFPVKIPQDLKRFGKVSVFPFMSTLNHYAAYLKDKNGDLEQIKSNWKTKIEEKFITEGYETFSIFTSENVLLTCVIEGRGTLNTEQAVKLLKAVQLNAKFVVSEEHVPISSLYQSYRLLFRSLKYLPAHSTRVIFPVKEEAEREYVYPEHLEAELLHAFFQLDHEQVEKVTEQLFHTFKDNHFLLEDVVRTGEKLLNSVLERYEKLLGQGSDYPTLHYREGINLEQFNSYSLLESQFREDLKKLVQELNLSQSESKDWLIERAEEYIQSYYTSEIKAHEVADVINISPNYFSSLFKQKTGKKFNEYVHDLRVNRSKILLAETPFKVSEIAEQVGYQEYKYFVKVFKNYTGMTPTKYRRLMTIKS